jgi:NAD(P)-dependent dehydrogenase (short-subunit alcohol dehydrogenase family)
MVHNQGKVALVTGGNKGIGFAIAEQLAQAGVQTILGARDEDKGKQALEALRKKGLQNVAFVQLDVTDAQDIQHTVDTLSNRYGHLDILVNNAGILPDEDSEARGIEVDPDTMQKVFETNTLAPLRLTQALIPLIKKSESGRIVNISSGLGALHDMDGGYLAYRVSKTALNAITRVLAAELQNSGVTVNAVCPGWVRTDMGGPNASRSPEESAAGIVPLLIDDAPGHTGQFLRDGQPIEW